MPGPGGRRPRKPFAAAATATARTDPDANQDSFVVLAGAGGGPGVVVADGVGAWERSGVAARAAATAAAQALRDRGPTAIEAAFRAAHGAVIGLDDSAGRAGTTLLVVTVPEPGHLLTGYVGNGALLLVSPVAGRPAGGSVPLWANHLLPHCGLEDGRDVLTRAFTTEEREPPRPSLAWHAPGVPVAVAVVTDGLWSHEQAPVGRTQDGMRWEQQPLTLTRTLTVTEQVMEGGGAGTDDADHATTLLTDHLRALRSEGLLEDDATIGVVVP